MMQVNDRASEERALAVQEARVAELRAEREHAATVAGVLHPDGRSRVAEVGLAQALDEVEAMVFELRAERDALRAIVEGRTTPPAVAP